MVRKKRSFSGHLQSYVGKIIHKKMDTRWRKMGYFSESDYLRDLVRADLKKDSK